MTNKTINNEKINNKYKKKSFPSVTTAPMYQIHFVSFYYMAMYSCPQLALVHSSELKRRRTEMVF